MNQLMTHASLLIRSLGWTLVHSFWQGAMITAGLWLVLWILPQARSGVRYHLSLAALSLLGIWVAGTWIQQWQLLQSISVQVTEAGLNALPARSYIVQASAGPIGDWPWLNPILPSLERFFPWLVAAYTIGLLVMGIRLASALHRMYLLQNRNLIMPQPEWLRLLDSLCERLEISGRIRLYGSAQVPVPLVMGFLKPVILLPAAALARLSPDQLETILLHELAHIRRGDFLVNLFQTLVETLLFFNPFVWQLSAAIRREREHCCDDLVLDHSPDRLPYAHALVSLEMARFPAPAGTLAASGQPRHLLNRIQRIMEMKKQPLPISRICAVILVITAVTTSVIYLTPAFGQSKKNPVTANPKGPIARPVAPATPPPAPAPAPPIYPSAPVADQALRQSAHPRHEDLPESLERMVDEALENIPGEDLTRQQELETAANTLKQLRKENRSVLSTREQRELEAALESAGRALKEVDLDQIRQEVSTRLKEVDWTRIETDIRKELDALPGDPAEPEARVIIQKKLKSARAEDQEATAEAWADDRDQHHTRTVVIEKRSTGTGSERAESDGFPHMLDLMEADGLINRNQGFTLSSEGHQLLINGAAQSDAVRRKYASYLDGKRIQIAGTKRNLSIQVH